MSEGVGGRGGQIQRTPQLQPPVTAMCSALCRFVEVSTPTPPFSSFHQSNLLLAASLNRSCESSHQIGCFSPWISQRNVTSNYAVTVRSQRRRSMKVIDFVATDGSSAAQVSSIAPTIADPVISCSISFDPASSKS